MSGNTFTVGELATAVGIHVRAITKMLNDAGAQPRLSELVDDPNAIVTRNQVTNLFAMRSGDRVGRKLADVLHQQ